MDPCTFTLNYDQFLAAIDLLKVAFPFSLLFWLKDFFTALITISPVVPTATLHLLGTDINVFQFLEDADFVNGTMVLLRWALASIFTVGFFRSIISKYI